MGFFRHLLPVVVGACAGAAALLVAQKLAAGQEHEHIVGPEAFCDDAAEPENAASETAPAAQDGAAPQTPQQAGAVEPKTTVYRPVDHTTPNVNPVRDVVEKAPVDADGKIDVEHIASPEDFGNWDDLGCQG